MPFKFNATTGLLDLVRPSANTSLATNIPQYTSDPALPNPQDAWVLRQGSGVVVTGGGTLNFIHGLALAVLSTGSGGGASYTYQFSYRTKENTTKRVTIS
jgi:hypothetical protein